MAFDGPDFADSPCRDNTITMHREAGRQTTLFAGSGSGLEKPSRRDLDCTGRGYPGGASVPCKRSDRNPRAPVRKAIDRA